MERTAVSSSNIASVGYDEGSQTLEVEFIRGAVYQYFDVPQSIFIEMMGAGSVGSYFASAVKDSYRYAQN